MIRVFTETLSPPLTAQWQHSVYRERKIAIVVAAIGEKELFCLILVVTRPGVLFYPSIPALFLSSGATEFRCPEEFGYYQHPTECSLYYVCVFGGPLLESCTGEEPGQTSIVFSVMILISRWSGLQSRPPDL